VDPAAARARARLPVRAFEQAIANLLDNAAEANRGPAARDVRISLERAGEELRMVVADNGVGVPEPLLRRIGEPSSPPRSRAGDGPGPLSGRATWSSGGREMRVDSTRTVGTRVTLTMPEGLSRC